MRVITHRGLDADKSHYFLESSREAFEDQLNRGFGLEFDVQPTKDKKFIIIHDSTLKRLSSGQDERNILDINSAEILSRSWGGYHLLLLGEFVRMVENKQTKDTISALHLKSKWQESPYLESLVQELETTDKTRYFIFDLKVETAKKLKEFLPNLSLAASVSHPYDIARYGEATGGTLLSIEEALESRNLYDWVWLDEWDRKDASGSSKALYSKTVFKRLRDVGFKIALVTPELHVTSPGLLGGEAHEDARNRKVLLRRLREIVSLVPDLICTDHPDTVDGLISITP